MREAAYLLALTSNLMGDNRRRDLASTLFNCLDRDINRQEGGSTRADLVTADIDGLIATQKESLQAFELRYNEIVAELTVVSAQVKPTQTVRISSAMKQSMRVF